MEKEINFEYDFLSLNFYYEGFDFSEEELGLYSSYLEKIGSSFNSFLCSELKLIEFKSVLNLNVCNDEVIQGMNKAHRNKDQVTDVLSFPLQNNIRNGEYETFFPELELGDIYVCHSVCEKQAVEFSLPYIEEFAHLAVHGFLHLMGYDHDLSLDEEKLMESLEEKLLLKLKTL
jgi:probable rRNA maturation factor